MENKLNSIWERLKDTNYIILRNYENIQEELEAGGDIDLLCESKEELIKILNLVPRFEINNMNNCKVLIDDVNIPIDVRYVGDNYYDINWERDMLKRKEKKDKRYVISKYDKDMSLLYHILLHKKAIPDKYINFVSSTYNTLDVDKLLNHLAQFMNENRYKVSIPLDKGVRFNNDNFMELRKRLADG